MVSKNVGFLDPTLKKPQKLKSLKCFDWQSIAYWGVKAVFEIQGVSAVWNHLIDTWDPPKGSIIIFWGSLKS